PRLYHAAQTARTAVSLRTAWPRPRRLRSPLQRVWSHPAPSGRAWSNPRFGPGSTVRPYSAPWFSVCGWVTGLVGSYYTQLRGQRAAVTFFLPPRSGAYNRVPL